MIMICGCAYCNFVKWFGSIDPGSLQFDGVYNLRPFSKKKIYNKTK